MGSAQVTDGSGASAQPSAGRGSGASGIPWGGGVEGTGYSPSPTAAVHTTVGGSLRRKRCATVGLPRCPPRRRRRRRGRASPNSAEDRSGSPSLICLSGHSRRSPSGDAHGIEGRRELLGLPYSARRSSPTRRYLGINKKKKRKRGERSGGGARGRAEEGSGLRRRRSTPQVWPRVTAGWGLPPSKTSALTSIPGAGTTLRDRLLCPSLGARRSPWLLSGRRRRGDRAIHAFEALQ